MCVSGSTTLILEEYTIHISDPSNFQVVNVDKQYFRKVTYTPLAWTAALGSPILLKIMNSFSGAAEPPGTGFLNWSWSRLFYLDFYSLKIKHLRLNNENKISRQSEPEEF